MRSSSPDMEDRLQKLLSKWGVASRRQAEQMILSGRVKLNGKVVELGQKADPQRDRIEVDGRIIKRADRPEPLYLLLNKPMGVVSTCRDPQGRPTVTSLLSPELRQGRGLHPVGRLDADSTGAILLTNDGDLTFRLAHPKHCVSKTYHVWVQDRPPENVLQAWRQGIVVDGKKTLPAQIRVLKKRHDGSQTLLEVVLKEGRNRQIRRVAALLGYPVVRLHRVAIGPIELQPPGELLLPGQYRPLKDFELDFLKGQVALTSIDVSAVKEHSV